MFGLKAWRRRRILKQYPIADDIWRQALDAVPLLQALDRSEQQRLRELATVFRYDKDYYGAAELEVDALMATIIAAQSCLPVLRLGPRWLEGWHSIYVYPGAFRTNRRYHDELGLESEDDRELSGEAQHAGGMVLSWQDIVDDIEIADDGQNVIIHEMAHKLDMRNGEPDGYPPLHRGMSSHAWSAAMKSAFDDMNEQLDRGRETELDPYAATEPAEFFAVMSEYFFEAPHVLREVYPDVFEQLALFYRWPVAQPGL